MTEKRLVLIIDDDQSVCRLLKSHLGASGYEVEVAYSGEAGLKLAKDLRPGLVILDLLLPGMDGFQVCRRLREDPTLASTKILMLTAIYMSEEDRLSGFKVGADDFLIKPDLVLAKPVHLRELTEAVEATFGGEPAPSQAHPGKDRVLVVDNDESNLRLMKMRLQSEGLEVAEAGGGQEGLDLLEPFQPHLVLLDINMPGMSGLDVLQEIRNRGLDVPVVMMTAYGSEAIAVEAFKLGADDYLIKPFDSGAAARLLHQVMEGYRLRKSRNQLTQRLKKISCDLVNRVNHLEVQNRRLEEAYEKVRGLSGFNQRFIKSLSQDLRSPLGMILSFSSLLRDTPREERDIHAEGECLAAIFRTAFRLEVNLSNLIYLSRIQADSLNIVPGAVALQPVLEECVNLVGRTVSRDDIRLTFYPESDAPRVQGDAALLRDITINLLDSAVQRMEGPGEIVVEVMRSGGEGEETGARAVLVRIRDTGTPFSQEDLALTNLVDMDMESMKLGSEHIRLNLCRNLASRLNWSLDVANRPTGGGQAVLRMEV